MTNQNDINKLADHLFRHESGKMISVLTKVFGIQNLETAEDVVQQTFIDAIAAWKIKGIPSNPPGWLFRVAKNKTIDILRRNKHSVLYDFSENEDSLPASEYSLATTIDNLWKPEFIKDDQLRMMFTCCHPGISQENQITLILKTLCGFSTGEIAKAFLNSEETVSKRLYRTKEFFREHKVQFIIPTINEFKSRVETVISTIYLLFNEGYNSTEKKELIRNELIDEAMLLGKLLADNYGSQLPQIYALMALMCFHSARIGSRLTTEGEIILLPNQDRDKWNRELIDIGNEYMNRAANGHYLSRYHLEAAIAYEYCVAATFEKTNWRLILERYELLCTIVESPVVSLNKIVVVMQVHGVQKALAQIEQIEDRKKLEPFYLYHALLGEIYLKLNNFIKAMNYFEAAFLLTKSEAEKNILQSKIKTIRSKLDV